MNLSARYALKFVITSLKDELKCSSLKEIKKSNVKEKKLQR